MKLFKKLLAWLLRYIDPRKPLGTELFNAIARISVTLNVNLVILRKNNGVIEVLLTQRGLSEAYPGQWHCPGSIIRPGECEFEALGRCARNELGVDLASTRFISNFNNPHEERGHFFELNYLVKIKTEVLTGQWFPVDSLPENVVSDHRACIIPETVREFA